jgi:hypothetical protein
MTEIARQIGEGPTEDETRLALVNVAGEQLWSVTIEADGTQPEDIAARIVTALARAVDASDGR